MYMAGGTANMIKDTRLRIYVEYFSVVLVMTFAVTVNNPLAWVVAWVTVGIRQHALLCIGHMAAHRRVDCVSERAHFLTMGMMGIDWAAYRKFHFAHHAHLGDKQLDPEVVMVSRYKSFQKPYRYRTVVADLLGLHINESIYILQQMSTVRSVVTYVLILAAMLWAFGPVVMLWPLSLLTWGQLLNRLRNRTEHDHLNRPGVTLPDVKPNLFMRLFLYPHGVWKHENHHLLP